MRPVIISSVLVATLLGMAAGVAAQGARASTPPASAGQAARGPQPTPPCGPAYDELNPLPSTRLPLTVPLTLIISPPPWTCPPTVRLWRMVLFSKPGRPERRVAWCICAIRMALKPSISISQ